MADDPATTEPGPGPGKNPVHPWLIVLLALYLVIVAITLLWNIYNRWPSCVSICTNETTASAVPTPSQTATATPASTAQPIQTPTPRPTVTATPTPTPTPRPTQSQSPTPIQIPVIESVSPKSGLSGCNIQVTIKGKNFSDGATVSFDGVPAIGKVDPSGLSINVQPPLHIEGQVDLVVKNGDGTTSDIAKNAFTYTCPPLRDTDLLLLVIFAGALGGTLHSLRSLYWYVGCRDLLQSWTLMYVLLPVTGSVLSVIFYSVIRAGLIPAPTNKDASVAIIAIAILVGLFSQQAAVKLKDIFEALLAKPASGPPGESKPQGSVPPGSSQPGVGAPKPTFDKPQGKAGDTVHITGTGMKTVQSVTFGTIAATNVTLTEGVITATVPAQPAGTDPKVNVVVKGDTGTVTLPFTYQP